jgi:hypothetical protein
MSFGKVSVVQMAFAAFSQWSCESPRELAQVEILGRILSMGRLTGV